MLLFIESGIRGYISQCFKRYDKAKNAYMKEQYNLQEQNAYLMYYDLNNMYGTTMSEHLLFSNFEWVDLFSNNIQNIEADTVKMIFIMYTLDNGKIIIPEHRLINLPYFC